MVQAVEVAHHQQQVRGLLHRKEPGKQEISMEWMYKREANLLLGTLIPMYHHHYRHHHHQEQQRHHPQPASRDVDPNGAVEALHGGANRGLQLVDVQSPVQRLQDRQFKIGSSNNSKPIVQNRSIAYLIVTTSLSMIDHLWVDNDLHIKSPLIHKSLNCRKAGIY